MTNSRDKRSLFLYDTCIPHVNVHRIAMENSDYTPLCSSRSSRVAVEKVSLFPSSSNPIILEQMMKYQVSSASCDRLSHYLSFDMPLTKHITQGRTLMPSFSTRKGTFSTNTRRKR